MGESSDWRQSSAPQLWRYNLHYFEWGWSLVAHPDRDRAKASFSSLWRSWRAGTVFGKWDEWSPYVASVRAWALCGLFEPLVAGTEIEQDVLRSLRLHSGFIRKNLEHDVGGNHLLKNLKGLIGLAVFLNDPALLVDALGDLGKQLEIQVLEDGGHFERSPSYHCQVLGDLIDVHDLLVTAGDPAAGMIEPYLVSMRLWLGMMLMPDGDVPLFNDCELVGQDRIRLLEPTAVNSERIVVLQPSGYATLRPSDNVHLCVDIGPPCPPELPAHAQADCLSFELALQGRRVIVDTGTSTYESGPRRQYERSTPAHNTVAVDGLDQTEVWGQFRAGRLAEPVLEEYSDRGNVLTLTASHNGYRRLSGRPVHRRSFMASPGGLTITDAVVGSGVHEAVVTFHVAPGEGLAEAEELSFEPSGLSMKLDPDADVTIDQKVEVASRFGRRSRATAIRGSKRGALPLEFRTILEVGKVGGAPQ